MASSSRTHEAYSSSSKHWMYDVFLSFRGEDTRKSFTGHLYMTLKEAGINAFIDDNELRRGENITAELVRAIQGSRISVIVFSRRYADSSWCLEELVKITECRTTLGQLVLPIFYDVDPSDVRRQAGCFAQAFQKHEERFCEDTDKVERWRAALTEAANLSGWDLRNTADGHEGKFIRKIIDEISKHLNSTYLHVANYQVGIDSRMQDISYHLGVGSDEVRMVGIWGMGGLGKTTVAKAIHNHFYRSFEGSSFLENIRETAKETNGLVRLQKQLLSDILKPIKKIKVHSVARGITMIEERLRCRRVLVIIDDIDRIDQLNAIAGNRDWFGSGSRIIITTRDEHLLKLLKVDSIYPAQAMNNKEALQLFSWHAFGNWRPSEGRFEELSRSVVAYCGGLPLALKVLGSFMFERTITEWESALKKLEAIPDHSQILEKLKIGFDGLSTDGRDIFLDIACFFIGKDKNYIQQILDGCGFSAEMQINVLIQRCLVTVSERNKLMMHDLLRDMGREIVRERSPKERGKWSRLWHYEDVDDVLTKHSGTEEIEGLALNFLRSDEANFTTKAFTNMQRLRLLQLNYVQLTGSYEYLSKELRWLCWHGFPLKLIPNGFNQRNVVAIDLRYSNLRQVWKNPGQLLEKLKILNLSHSDYLTESPDFSRIPNLEKLMLKDCRSLSKVHQSIGLLERLSLVNLKDCKMLKDLPRSFYKSKSIETLVLSGCSKFENLAEDLGEMVSLSTLLADNTAIRKVPFTIVQLKNLRYLSLCGLKGSPSKSLPSLFWSWAFPREVPDSTYLLLPSLQGLNSLTKLSLRDCNLTDGAIPKDLGSLFSLEELDLERNSFHSLPSLIGLSKLDYLSLNGCINLRAIPDLPKNLEFLEANNCTELEIMPDFSEMLNMRELYLQHSLKLIEIPGLNKSLNSLTLTHMEGCTNLTTSFKESISQGWTASGHGGIFLPGDDYFPDWFEYVEEDDRVSFEVPQTVGCNLKGLTLCIGYCIEEPSHPGVKICIRVVNETKRTCHDAWPMNSPGIPSQKDYLWLGQLSNNNKLNLEGGDLVHVLVFGARDGFSVKKTGVSLVTDKFINEEDSLSDWESSDCTFSDDDIDEAETSNSHDSFDLNGPPKTLRSDAIQMSADDDGSDDEAGSSHDSYDEDQPPKRWTDRYVRKIRFV